MSRKKSIAILAIIAMVLMMVPTAMFAATADSDRLSGANRIETALEICDAGWDTADTVILAPADEANLVDALAAGPLAGQEKAPILLTFKGALNADVKAKIAALKAKKVYVIGAISDAVKDEVAAISGVTVEKLAGSNRIATAKAITAKLTSPAGTFVVGFDGLADALSVASYAAANNYAIAIANGDGSIDSADLVGSTKYIVGGTARVKDIDGVTRFAGNDRFATNAAVAEGLTFNYATTYVANGLTLVDALAVAPLASKTGSFVLLVSKTDGKAVAGMTASTKIIAVGGTSAVPASVIDGLFGTEDDSEFTVKTAEAPNLKQIVLELSNDNYYDEEELKTADNYEFEGDDATTNSKSIVDINVAKVSVKGTTVTLNLANPVANQTKGNLVIESAVTGEELEFEDIEFFDNTIPEIADVKVIGKDTIKVIFSEPMAALASQEDEFEIKAGNKSFGVDKVVGVADDYHANVQVYGTFPEGPLTVEVGNGLEDYAGFNVMAETFEVDVVKDTEAPEVTGYKDAKSTEVTLLFNEDIQFTESTPDADDFYHTNTSNDSATRIIRGPELTLTFAPSNELPDGSAYVYIAAGAISDLWDNENNSIKVKIEIAADNTDPEVKEVEYNADGDIVVTFSEKMDEATAEDTGNYELSDPDGKDMSLRSAVLNTSGNSKKVTLDIREASPKKGTYELFIEDVEDTAGNKMADATFEVVIGDTGAPSFPGTVYYEGTGTEWKLYVNFTEEMAVEGTYSIDDLYKYEIYDTSATKYINLGTANEKDEFDVDLDIMDNNQTVRLSINGFALDAADTFRMARVADAEGNYSDLSSGLLGLTLKSAQTITIVKVGKDAPKAINDTTIKLVFSSNLDTLEPADFIVWDDTNSNNVVDPGETTYTIDDLDFDGAANKAVMTIDDDVRPLAANMETVKLTVGTIATPATIKTVNSYGAKLAASDFMTVADECAPNVAKEQNKDTSKPYISPVKNGNSDDVPVVYGRYDDATDKTTVTVKFTEPVRAIAPTDIKVNDGKDTVSSVDALDNGTTGTLKFVVDAQIFKGEDILIPLINDISVKGNYTTELDLQIEYVVNDNTAPAALATPADVTVNATNIVVAAGSSYAGAIIKVVADGAAPTATAVAQGTKVAATALTLNGLTTGTAYDVYVIDASGNASAKLDITTP